MSVEPLSRDDETWHQMKIAPEGAKNNNEETKKKKINAKIQVMHINPFCPPTD